MKLLKKTIYGASALALAGYGIGKYLKYNNKSIEVNKRLVESSLLPKSFDNFRIVQVSDLQSQEFGKDQKNLIKAVRRARPDIVVITGDLLDRNHTDFDLALKAVVGLNSLAPVFYVNGNHELKVDKDMIEDFYDEIEALGVHILMDEYKRVKRGDDYINIVGLSEQTVLGTKEMTWELGEDYSREILSESVRILLSELDEGYTILLSHEPQYIKEYAAANPNLVFCGHAHGGQFRLPNGQGLYAPGQGIMPKFTEGIHVWENTTMIISRGLGNSIFPFRLNNRPEIILTILKSK